MTIERFVVCRPQGGLNDVLCQIEKVCQYADRFNRTVIIDTNQRSTRFIKDQFSNYFVSRQERVIVDATDIESRLKDIGVVPGFLAGDLHRYEAYFDQELARFVEKNTRQQITFDFTKDYAEPVLVHHASGRVRGASVAALARLRLRETLSDDLVKRLNSIGRDYVAIHIRNADYTTNYQLLLNQAKGRPALQGCSNLFVATDDFACLEYCRKLFAGINIISFSKLPPEPGRPIHRFMEHDDVYQRNKDAILDLMMLALARKFILLELNPNRWGAKYSGYSVLAHELRNSRATLNSLIARPEIAVDQMVQ